jgi:hypothetical protein
MNPAWSGRGMPAPNQPTTTQINPTGETRLVLNTDTVICRGCYEPDVLEVDSGRVPIGESHQLPCAICGAGEETRGEGRR